MNTANRNFNLDRIKRTFNRISVRLILGYGSLLVFFFAVVVLTFNEFRSVSRSNAQFANRYLPRLLAVQSLNTTIESTNGALLRLFTSDKGQRVIEYTNVDKRNQQIVDSINSLQENAKPEVQKILRELKIAHEKYKKSYIDTVDLLEDEGQPVAILSYKTVVNNDLLQMLGKSNSLLESEKNFLVDAEGELQDDLDKTRNFVILLSLCGLAAGASFAFLATQSVVNPLKNLELFAKEISNGIYTTKYFKPALLEFQQLGTAFNLMAKSIATREKEIERLAYFDALTELKNRNALLLGSEAFPEFWDFAVLLDLSRLQTVNETLGYETGDDLIRSFAAKIQEVLGQHQELKQHNLYRLSGGTFTILIRNVRETHIENFIANLNVELTEPILCNDYYVDMNFVAGCVELANKKNEIMGYICNAECALNDAKNRLKKFAWFSEVQEASRLEHLSLVSDLRFAIKDEQLQMWLQPKINLHTGDTIGFEALVRWSHPVRGLIAPIKFIPFAEATGHIELITNFILRRAVRTLAEWEEEGIELSISVNVSTHDLSNVEFASDLKNLVQSYQVDPSLLVLELTESSIMKQPEEVIRSLGMIRKLGIKISIDDFGTGYSSLSYLQRLPIDELKIDQSFIRNLDQSIASIELVTTITNLAHAFGLTVTAEGVENASQNQILKEIGCDLGQGYLYSRPIYGNELTAWTDASRALVSKNVA